MTLKKRHVAVAAFPLILALHCGASQPETTVEETSLSAAQLDADEEPAAPAAPTCEREPSVLRTDLDALLAQGPARLLAKVQSDSHKEQGRFVGFKIVSFRVDIDPCLDLREGDVVTRVNGHPIERPEQYFKVFEKLKTARELRFDILRAGSPMTLVYPII